MPIGIVIVLALLVLLLVCAFVAWSVRAFRQHRSRSWPQSEGEIVMSDVASVASSTPETGRRRLYQAAVEFRYAVNDQEYSGHNVRLISIQSSNAAAHRSVAKRYPPGKIVTVYHHPRRAALSLLEPGLRACDIFVGVALFALLAILGGYALPTTYAAYAKRQLGDRIVAMMRSDEAERRCRALRGVEHLPPLAAHNLLNKGFRDDEMSVVACAVENLDRVRTPYLGDAL